MPPLQGLGFCDTLDPGAALIFILNELRHGLHKAIRINHKERRDHKEIRLFVLFVLFVVRLMYSIPETPHYIFPRQ